MELKGPEPTCLRPTQSYNMVKYVLTGATGELGSRVFRNLIKLVPGKSVLDAIPYCANSLSSK